MKKKSEAEKLMTQYIFKNGEGSFLKLLLQFWPYLPK
jgi:hypothetical protein